MESSINPRAIQNYKRKGTERPHSGALCSIYDEGQYNCICCNTPLFDSTIKYSSGTGWPSFTQPIKRNAIKYHKDTSFGAIRIEALCNTCDAHLGHVFPDGPEPSGLRYCINSESMQIEKQTGSAKKMELATFGGGCFWCTEAVFKEIKGVEKVVSGYSGGATSAKPTYKEVCSGLTGYAEVIQIHFDTNIISYQEILNVFITTHDPTTLNRQGGDHGTQYRSVIFYHNEFQKETAKTVLKKMASYYQEPIITEISPLNIFFEAEEYHQDYYANNKTQSYCSFVITPKLAKLRKLHSDKLKIDS